MRDKETSLTIKQLAFAKAYALDSNAGRAYTAAGYKSNGNERIQGYKLLQNDKILAIIGQEKAKVAIKSELTREKALADIEYGIEKAKERNNLPALARFTELECRTLGMLTDNLNTTDTQRQRELDEKQTQEAGEIAKIRLRELKVG